MYVFGWYFVHVKFDECVSFHIESDSNSTISPFILLDRRLSHISQEMMKRLVQDDILLSLPDVILDVIKGS